VVLRAPAVRLRLDDDRGGGFHSKRRPTRGRFLDGDGGGEDDEATRGRGGRVEHAGHDLDDGTLDDAGLDADTSADDAGAHDVGGDNQSGSDAGSDASAGGDETLRRGLQHPGSHLLVLSAHRMGGLPPVPGQAGSGCLRGRARAGGGAVQRQLRRLLAAGVPRCLPRGRGPGAVSSASGRRPPGRTPEGAPCRALRREEGKLRGRLKGL